MDKIEELKLNNCELNEIMIGIKDVLNKSHPEAANIKFVGYQFHFLIDEILASIGGFSSSFNLSDYE